MKKLILLSLISMTILISSCKKEKEIDYTKPENLVGTTWKYTDPDISTTIEYGYFKFISKTTVEYWLKDSGESEVLFWTDIYTITGNKLTFDTKPISGTIEGIKINITNGSKIYVFTKE